MIVLLSTDTLEMVLGAAHTTNALNALVSYKDANLAAGTLVMGRLSTATSGTTPVDLVTSPTGSTQRVVDHIVIYNRDTIAHTVTITFDDGTTPRIIGIWVLASGDVLQYSGEAGWSRLSSTVTPSGYQSIKSFTVHGDASANFAMSNATNAERFAANTSRHIFMVDLSGYTQVRLRANVQVASASVNTPKFRAKYNTSWSTTVGAYSQLGDSAQVEISVAATGYLDTGWLDLAVGARADGVAIAFTELGGDAAADPALGATDILFR